MSGRDGVQDLLRSGSSTATPTTSTTRPGSRPTAQQEKLLEIVRRNADTDYGREHGFERIRSVDDFRQAVPPQHYETLAP